MTSPENPVPPPETPTPGDIEAALTELRAQMAAPAPTPAPAPDEPKARAAIWVGGAALLIGAVLGGGGASFLLGYLGVGQERAAPQVAGVQPAELEAVLEAQTIAAAKTSADLISRLDGAEARLQALETKSAAPVAESAAAADLAATEVALNALAERVALLETRLSEAARQPAQAAPTSPETVGEIAALKSALADVTARLGTLERVAPAGDLIASLDGRVTALETADPGRASRQAALALIVARLGDAAAEGRPFAAELAALKAAAPAIDVSPFAPYADKGLPTVAVLAANLDAIDGAVREGADFDRGGDWLDRMWRGLGRLITVREDGLAEGREPEDHLARARYHAGRGDLANARAEMDRLSGAARGAAAPWLADAGARLALDAALGALTETILADLARPVQ